MLEQNWRVPRRAQPGDGARRMVLTAAALCAGVGVAVTAAIVLAGSHPTWIPAALRAPTVGAAAIIRFYGGVGTLVALSLTVTVGLLAADRGLLDARRRVRAQSAHRALSVLTVVLLGTHLLTEITAHRIGALDAAVPFLGTTAFLGLGSVAAYLIVAAMWIGIVRGRFAGNGRPGLWRVLHATGYLSWPTALVHGLYAGRTPAVWVVASYLLLLLLVIVALGRRLVAERRHRRAHRAAVVPTAARRIPKLAQPVSAPPAYPADDTTPQPGPAVPVAPMAGDVPPAVEPPRRSNVTSLDAPVVSLDTRRAARDGSSDLGIGRRSSDAFDEVDERYLAALRGEAR